ncbi:hypothetical protein D3C73_1096100 [compost metagenome]
MPVLQCERARLRQGQYATIEVEDQRGTQLHRSAPSIRLTLQVRGQSAQGGAQQGRTRMHRMHGGSEAGTQFGLDA